MKRLLLLIGFVLLFVISGRAQSLVLMQNAAAATGNGQVLTLSPAGNTNGASVQVVLTGTATITFEATFEASNTNWTAVAATNAATQTAATTATASGIYTIAVPGAQQVRARISAYSSGTVTVKGRAEPSYVTKNVSGGGGGGSGTVTDVSVVTANGVSGSVANSTTTPAITLTLGDITPTSVSTGNLTSSSLTAGRIPFAGTAGLLTDSANLTTTSTGQLLANATSTSTSASNWALRGTLTSNPATNSTARLFGVRAESLTQIAGNNVNFFTVGALDVDAAFNSTGTATSIESYSALTYNQAGSAVGSLYGIKQYLQTDTGTTTNSYGGFFELDTNGGAVTNSYGLRLNNPVKAFGGTVTNNYGLYIENQTAGGTLNYSIYSAGGTAHFGGIIEAGSGPVTWSDSGGHILSAALNTVAPTQGGIGISLAGIAKGGMISGSGPGTFSITTIGTDGQVWTADAASTGGAKWATSAGGGLTIGTTTITSGTSTRLLFDLAGVVSEDADLTFVTDTLTATKVVAPTSLSTPSLITASGALTITPASNAAVLFSTTERIQVGGTTNHFQALRASTDSALQFPMALETADDGSLGYLKLNELYFQTGSFNTASASVRIAATTGLVQINSSGRLDFTSATTITTTSPTVQTNISQQASGVLQIGTSSANAVGSLLMSRKVTAKTADYPVVAGDSNTFFTNTGASAGVNFTLPTAVVGQMYEFYRDANQTVTITAGASTTIRVGSSVTASAGNVTLDAVGSKIRLTAISTTQWAGDITGTATFN